MIADMIRGMMISIGIVILAGCALVWFFPVIMTSGGAISLSQAHSICGSSLAAATASCGKESEYEGAVFVAAVFAIIIAVCGAWSLCNNDDDYEDEM